MLDSDLPVIKDEEDSKIPDDLPPVIDAHVHVFPRSIFSAIWQWFDKYAWSIRYRLRTYEIFDFLLSRGITHVVAMQYAHKPGIAGKLNRYMAKKYQEYQNQITGMATVFPGEDNARRILQEAFDSGLGGLKLHAHVQCFRMNSDSMNLLYECCRANKKPVVMHVGREPKSTAYPCDPYEICSADELECVLREFPDLKICVPHLGFDEISEYRKLAEKYDNLWLDTTMVIADYFPIEEKIDLNQYRSDRIIYGSDFPNIPYAWDRELKRLKNAGISPDIQEKILNKNAAEFFGIHEPGGSAL